MSIPFMSIPPARFGPFEVDFRAGELLKNGRRIRLQDQPLQVLAMLLERPGNVVTRDEFRQKLWPNDTFVDFDHGLNNAVNKLRDALNDSAEAPRFIETLPRRGYRFIAPVEATTRESRTEPLIGQRLAHYRVIEEIGAGGMGVVYRAKDERLDREVALKVLPAGALADENTRNQFHTEALALAKLNQPNIETLYGMETQNGVDFLVMELVPGVTLRERLSAGALPEREVARLGLQLASALEEAHERGVVHRDLKPGNIVVTPKGQAKVLDFGLARLLRPPTDVNPSRSPANRSNPEAEVAGTLCYMAPEQLGGEPGNAPTDLYALGAVLYEMATGHRVFQEELEPQLIEAILHTSPTPPRSLNARISFDLDRIILKCLDKKPENRYQSAKELSLDLRRLAGPASFLTSRIPWDVQPLRRRSVLRWRAGVAAIVLLAILAAAIVGVFYYLRSRESPSDSVAVLPFANNNTSPNGELLGDGITSGLIESLSQVPHLKVMSRSSVLRYKGREIDPRTVGRELNVRALLMGRIVQHGDSFVLDAELVNASDNSHIWGQQYNAKASEVLTLQEELARTISDKLGARLTTVEKARIAKQGTSNPEAYSLYVRGRYFADRFHAQDWKKALEFFQQAVEKDPVYAQAYAGMGDAYAVLAFMGTLPLEEGVQKAKAAAHRALELNENLAEAHAALAGASYVNWEWAVAEREARRAVELNPNLAFAHQYYSFALESEGKMEQGLAEVKRALELDPLSLTSNRFVGDTYYYLREYDRAIEQLLKAIELAPDDREIHSDLADCYLEKGDYDKAALEYQKALRLKAKDSQAEALGRAYANGGYRGLLKAQIGLWSDPKRTDDYDPYAVADNYSLLNDRGNAFLWLDKAYAKGDRMLPILVDPQLDNIRSDPRYKAFVRRMGLPP